MANSLKAFNSRHLFLRIVPNQSAIRRTSNASNTTDAKDVSDRGEKSAKADNGIKTPAAFNNLRAFFEHDVKNLGVGELRVKDRPGRAWSTEELRLKSNSDLHKLWYVLLKEKNMLLTMKFMRESRALVFANPERLDKVKESMENLESVVHERNDAVLRLETGDGSSPPERTITSFLGFTYKKIAEEHYEPFEVTKKKEYEMPYLDDDAYLLQKLFNEKQEMKRRIHEHDEYMRLMWKGNKNQFKRGLRKVFNRVEHLPKTIVQEAKKATSQ